MPNWGVLLLGVFVTLGLRQRGSINPYVIAVGATVVVLLGVAATEHLI